MEYDEADKVAGRYRAQDRKIARLYPARSAGGSGKNMLAAATLGFAAIVYVLAAQPFGDVLDFSGLPKTGEFRVLAKLRAEPTGLLKIAAPDEDIALHLLDADDSEVFVGFVRKGEECALTVPVGRWHIVVTLGTTESLRVATDLTLGQPLGIIEISPRGAVTVLRVVAGKPASQVNPHVWFPPKSSPSRASRIGPIAGHPLLVVGEPRSRRSADWTEYR